MKLTNYTKIPDALLRDMVRFCCPPGVSGYDITFKNSGDGRLSGWAYIHGTGYHIRKGKCPPLITISVPKVFGPDDKARSHDWQRKGRTRRELSAARQDCRGYMPDDAWTDHESLVNIIAHEMRHLWQRKVKSGRRVWGARGQYSERDADAYGIHMTRLWRRELSSAQ